MAIGDDFSVSLTGDIRYTGTTANYTCLDLHRWLQDLADDSTSSVDDYVSIVESTPSERSTDNIVSLINGYNIDDTAAEHIFDGSISQAGGDTVYSGLVVVGSVEAGTNLQIVQDNALLTSYWGTGLNADPANNILLRIMVKTRDAGADIDGKRLRVQAREYGDTFAEFSLTAGLGNSTAAIFTSADLNNTTASGTVAAYPITNTEGYNLIDASGDGVDEEYYSQWTGFTNINELYEYAKYIQRTGSAETIYGLSGELFRGITHSIPYDNEASGPFVTGEVLTFGGGATAQLLAVQDDGTTGILEVQLLTGVAPVDNETISGGTSGATADVNGSFTARTISPEFIGTSTGSALIGAFGVGVAAGDLSASDLVFDLDNNAITPPNNVSFTVAGLVVGEDRVLVGPEDGAGGLDVDQLSLSVTLSGAAETSVVVTTAIPSDTPASGDIRVQLDSGIYQEVPYSSWSGSTFTIPAFDFSADNATSGNNTFIAYLDILATATSESFTSVYSTDRTLFVRVRDGAASPIKTFETTGTLGSAGGSTTAIRTTDA